MRISKRAAPPRLAERWRKNSLRRRVLPAWQWPAGPLEPATAGGVSTAARVWTALAASVYLVLISGFLITHGSWPTPDILVPPLIIFALLLGRAHLFLVDWAPFLALWLLWQWLAGQVTPADITTADVTGPLELERRLFGVVPTVALQSAFFRPGNLAWYDWTAAFIHGAHFAVPVGFAFALWLRRRADFWRMAGAVLAMSYIGLIIYWQYPAAPPWMAAERGYMGGADIWRILGETLGRFPVTEPLGYAYQRFQGNPVAAVPSLHAALPLTVTLVLWRLRPRWALVTMTYTLLMTPALVYLGEHYVVDALAGWGVAIAAFVLTWVIEAAAVWVWPLLVRRLPQWRVSQLPPVQLLRWPAPPAWVGATRGAIYPGLPLAAVLLIIAGPLGYRPSLQLAQPLPPPPCILLPSTELNAVAGSARERLGPVVVFAAEQGGAVCYWSDTDRVLIDPETVRPVRLAALHRLLTDPNTLWDPVVPEGAITIRRTLTPESDPLVGTYSVLLLVLEPRDPSLASEQAEPVIAEAAEALRRTAAR